MKNISLSVRQRILFGMILFAAFTRLLPHPPNVTAVTAMALFAGAQFSNKKWAFLAPVIAMALSDIFLGFYEISVFVYLGFILVTTLGYITKKMNAGVVLTSSVLFFITTNLGVWFLHYPLTAEGLSTCFTLAIPFFVNSLIGDFFFAGLLFYSFSWVNQRYLRAA